MEGPCCVLKSMINFAYEVNTKSGDSFDLILLAEDDNYVLPDNIFRQYSNTTESFSFYSHFDPVCTSQCDVATCGGAGMLLTKSMLRFLVENYTQNEYSSFDEE